MKFEIGDKVAYLGPYHSLFPDTIAIVESFKGRALYLRFNKHKLIPISATNPDWIKIEDPNDILKGIL